MTAYLALKWLHVLSSVVLVGTGFGSAFYMFFANRSGSLPAQVVVSRLVVRADAWFTAPTVMLQPLTGIALAHLAGWPLSTPWLTAAIALSMQALLCWLPVVALQVRMARVAREDHDAGRPLRPAYARDARLWEALGYPAFAATVIVFYLMVAKPALWA